MARVAEKQAVAEPRDGAIEFGGEAAFCEDQFQLRHGDKGLADGIAIASQMVRYFEEDAVDFAHFLFGEAHQLVIEIDGLERFDEESVAARTGAVDDAVEFAALAGDDGHDE